MAGDMQSPFDDPILKAALKRACGGETAPPKLRARVEQALASEAAKLRPAAGRQFDWRRSPLVGLAAAAMILLSTGLILNRYWDSQPRIVRILPNDFASEMVAAHDQALAQSNHHNLVDVPKDDLNRIRQTLKERLGHPVLVASLGPEWKFQGASITKVGDTDASQLIFTRDSETVSVISVSTAGRPYYTPKDGTDYTQTFNEHPLAGVVQGGAVHCIIGSKNSKLSEKVLNRLRDKVRDLIAADTSTTSGCGTVARASAGL